MKANLFYKGLAAIALLGLPILASAQDYDDDIYYNPSKSTKTKTTATTAKRNTIPATNYVSQPNYAAAGTYTYDTGNTRDVDEYNRHGGIYADTISSAADSTSIDEFGYTRRIERFHNPNVVVNSGDADLIDYYYSTDASASDATTVNIYVVDDPFYYSSWRYPYYGWNRWSRWCYSPWYWDTYFGWGGFGWSVFDPFYSWSWGWGPGYFGWGLGWTFGGHSHWGGGHWGGGWHNVTPGAGRAHTPGGIGTSMNSARRASYSGNHNTNSSWSRPGNMGRGYGSSASALASPSRNGNSSGVTSTTTGRGRNGSGNSSSNSYNSNNSRRNSSSYNSNSSSSSSSRGSGSSWGGSRGSSGGFGGGSHSGGGGGGRGRR